MGCVFRMEGTISGLTGSVTFVRLISDGVLNCMALSVLELFHHASGLVHYTPGLFRR